MTSVSPGPKAPSPRLQTSALLWLLGLLSIVLFMIPSENIFLAIQVRWGLLERFAPTDLAMWLRRVALVGLLAFPVLILRWFAAYFLGFERRFGLRIIQRERAPKNLRLALLFCFVVAIAALAIMNTDYKGIEFVFIAAIASFCGLLLLLIQRLSIFGTTSIIGVVLGVAALVVVQSVATGFQHEFERRVLGVYSHINVMRFRGLGIAEYRRFEQFLRTLEGVQGASPFVYNAMMLAPYDPEGRRQGNNRLAAVLAKGIEPSSAHEVIDLQSHLLPGSEGPVDISALTSNFELMPVQERDPDELPPVIANTPDPRGPDAYAKALEHYEQLPAHQRWSQGDPNAHETGEDRDVWSEDDDWPDEPSADINNEDSDLPFDAESLPTIFMGVTLAAELGLEQGSLVTIVEPGANLVDPNELPQFQYYRIAGLFQAGFQEYDSRLIYMHIKELQRFKFHGQDQVSGIDLRLHDSGLAPQVGAAIREAFAGYNYEVLEWQQLNKNLFQSIRLQKNVITIILSLVITVAMFNVLSALWTMVVRRSPEIAILMSMGATGSQIARSFQVTGMTIGLAGSLAGIGFSLVLCWLVELYGYTLDPEVYFIERLPVEISITQIFWILGMTMAICFLATLPPALRAAQLRPVEGLRYE